MYTIDVDTKSANVYGYSVLLGAGAGSTLQLAYSVISVKLPRKLIPSGIQFINVAQIGTGSLMLPLAGCVFQNVAYRKLMTALAGRGFSNSALRAAVAGTSSEIFHSTQAGVKEAALKAIIDAMDNVWLLILALGAIEVFVSLFMQREEILKS